MMFWANNTHKIFASLSILLLADWAAVVFIKGVNGVNFISVQRKKCFSFTCCALSSVTNSIHEFIFQLSGVQKFSFRSRHIGKLSDTTLVCLLGYTFDVKWLFNVISFACWPLTPVDIFTINCEIFPTKVAWLQRLCSSRIKEQLIDMAFGVKHWIWC